MSSESEQTVLPFPEPGGVEFTAGHSGSETSRERALEEARSGKMAARQKMLMAYFHVVREEGMTVADVREITDLHHGQASSVLSVLHKEGKIARLRDRRDRCAIYVLPEHVENRATAPYTPNKKNRVEQIKAAVRAVCQHESKLGMDRVSIEMVEFALEHPEEAIRRFR